MGLRRSYAISSSWGRTGAAPVRTNFVLLQSVMDTFGCRTIPVMIGGTVMIAWFYVHRMQASLSQVFHEGAFLIKEGTLEKNGVQVANLRGLTISSAAVCNVLLFLLTI